MNSPGNIAGGHAVGEMRPKPVVALTVEAFNARFLDGPVHPLDLALVHEWFGLVNRCSMPFASQIMSKRI